MVHVQIMQINQKKNRDGMECLGIQRNVMKNNLTLSLKRKIYNQCILSLLSQRLETWAGMEKRS